MKKNRINAKSLTACVAMTSMLFSRQAGLAASAREDEGALNQIVSVEKGTSRQTAGNPTTGNPTAGKKTDIQETVRISNAKDLAELAARCSVDERSEGLQVLLTEDIDLGGVEFSSIPYFKGVFDGQGHSIRGLKIAMDSSVCGLFRYLGEGGLIKNLNVEGRLEPGENAQSVGGIVGDNEGTIQSCSFKGSVRAQQTAGGICGVNHDTGLVSNCVFEGCTSADHQAGGIAGLNDGILTRCRNAGEVNTEYIETDTKTKNNIVQGITNLSSLDISGMDQTDFIDIMDIGGIAGMSTGQILSCVNDGSVGYTRTGYNVGGIAGRSSGFILSCVNHGEVKGRKDVGGIAGQLEPESVWQYSKEKLGILQSELTQLNSLIDTFADDIAEGAGTTKEAVRTASGYAQQTISDLQAFTDGAAADLGDTQGQLKTLITKLESAFHMENAEAMNQTIMQLSQLISQMKLPDLPTAEEISDAFSARLYEILLSQGRGILAKWKEYLAQNGIVVMTGDEAMEQLEKWAEENGGNVSSQTAGDQSDSSSAPESILNDLIQDSASAQDTATGGQIVDGGIEQDSDSDEIIVDDSTDSEIFMSAGAENDIFSDSEDVQNDSVTGDSGAGGEILAAGDSEAGQAVTAVQESVKTGEADLIEDPDMTAADEENTPISASGMAGISWDLTGLSTETSDGQTVDTTGDTLITNIDNEIASFNANAATLRTLLSSILSDASGLLDPEALQGAGEILRNIEVTLPDTSAFYTSFQNLAESLPCITDGISSMSKKAAEDADAITDQMNLIITTFFDLTDESSLEDKYTKEDISQIDPYQSDDSSIEGCENDGSIDGDTNIGGVTGCVGMENKLDAEDTINISQYLLKEARYTVFASVRECQNTGEITAKKEAAGGIAGVMDFGVVTQSINAGPVSVPDGDYSGGISGKSLGVIMDSCAGSMVSGKTYTGGIAGQADSIRSCMSYSYIKGSGAYTGAIAGQAQGEVSDCRYVDYGIGGIDGVGYAGIAEPVDLEEMNIIAAEMVPELESTSEPGNTSETGITSESGNISETGIVSESGDSSEPGSTSSQTDTSNQGIGSSSKGNKSSSSEEISTSAQIMKMLSTCTVTFEVDGTEYTQMEVPFGGSIDTLPEVPNKGEEYWKWDDFDQDAIFVSMTVGGSWQRPVTTLASEGDLPDYLVEGVFYEGQSLRVDDYVPSQDPVSASTIIEAVEKKISGEPSSNRAAESKDEHFTEAQDGTKASTEDESLLNSQRKPVQAVREMFNNQLSGNVIDAKTLTVNDYEGELKVRLRKPAGGKLFVDNGDGSLKETTYEQDGSCIVFPLGNGGSYAYYESIRQNKDMRKLIAGAIAAIGGSILFIALILRRKRKKKKSQMKATKPEKK